MALFGRKTAEKKVSATVSPAAHAARDLSSVLVAPRVTEKAAYLADVRAYAFIVRRDATKYDVRDAIKALYKVTPAKINIVNRPARSFHSRARGRKGVLPGMRKAYVYLKEGDRIELA